MSNANPSSNQNSFCDERAQVLADLRAMSAREYRWLLSNPENEDGRGFLGTLAWAIQHLDGLPEHWVAVDAPTRKPSDCLHEHASITCTDCGIDFRNARVRQDETSGQRTPKDYAIEHAEYMAQAAEGLMQAANGLNVEGTSLEAIDQHSHAYRTLERRIYEFRKRAERAKSSAVEPSSRICPHYDTPIADGYVGCPDCCAEKTSAISCIYPRGCPNPAVCITAGCCKQLKAIQETLPENGNGDGDV